MGDAVTMDRARELFETAGRGRCDQLRARLPNGTKLVHAGTAPVVSTSQLLARSCDRNPPSRADRSVAGARRIGRGHTAELPAAYRGGDSGRAACGASIFAVDADGRISRHWLSAAGLRWPDECDAGRG